MIVRRSSVELEKLRRSGMLVFSQQTLGEAADQFNRYNNKKIVVDGAARRIRIGGSFKADNVDVFVLLLHRGFGLSVAMDVSIAGVDQAAAEEIVQAAHAIYTISP